MRLAVPETPPPAPSTCLGPSLAPFRTSSVSCSLPFCCCSKNFFTASAKSGAGSSSDSASGCPVSGHTEPLRLSHVKMALRSNTPPYGLRTGSVRGRSQMPQSSLRGKPSGTSAAAAARADGFAPPADKRPGARRRPSPPPPFPPPLPPLRWVRWPLPRCPPASSMRLSLSKLPPIVDPANSLSKRRSVDDAGLLLLFSLASGELPPPSPLFASGEEGDLCALKPGRLPRRSPLCKRALFGEEGGPPPPSPLAPLPWPLARGCVFAFGVAIAGAWSFETLVSSTPLSRQPPPWSSSSSRPQFPSSSSSSSSAKLVEGRLKLRLDPNTNGGWLGEGKASGPPRSEITDLTSGRLASWKGKAPWRFFTVASAPNTRSTFTVSVWL
mmetsp:Transcript_51485/g.95783  ORF Transcript_51485/g.95783 Transcript_51485/m.95783 type:complete len:383 (+) Transcript_51485:85-1233(+)